VPGVVLGGFSCTGAVWFSLREIRDMLLPNREGVVGFEFEFRVELLVTTRIDG
jgi:hypothetical protein